MGISWFLLPSDKKAWMYIKEKQRMWSMKNWQQMFWIHKHAYAHSTKHNN